MRYLPDIPLQNDDTNNNHSPAASTIISVNTVVTGDLPSEAALDDGMLGLLVAANTLTLETQQVPVLGISSTSATSAEVHQDQLFTEDNDEEEEDDDDDNDEDDDANDDDGYKKVHNVIVVNENEENEKEDYIHADISIR